MTYEDMSEELLTAAQRIKAVSLLEGAGCLVEAAAMLLGQESVTKMGEAGARSLLTHMLAEHDDGRTHIERERDDAVRMMPSNRNIALAYAIAEGVARDVLNELEAQS